MRTGSETSKAVCKRYAFLADQLAAAPGSMTEEFIRATHSQVDAALPPSAETRPPVRTFWHALYYPEERRVKFSFYLRDEAIAGQPDKVRIVRSDYLEFKLAPTQQLGATNVTSSAAPPPEIPDASEDDVIAQLKNAGATVKVERGHLTELGFAKGMNAEPFLALLRTLPRLRVLQLADTKLTDGGLGAIRELAQLEYVGLRGTAIGDRGLMYIGNLKG